MTHDMSEFPLTNREWNVMDFAVKRFPGAFLLGSYARDLHAHGLARLRRGRRTVDADFAVEVATEHNFSELVEGLTPLSGTGLCFTVDGFRLDLIPFGGVESGGIIEPQKGVTLDVTGMSEAHEHTVRFALRDGLVVRCPDLTALIVLKVIAWDYRQTSTTKDGEDLDLLLQATYSGEYAGEVWDDEESGDLLGWRPELVGPFRVGRRVPERYAPDVVARVREVVDGDSADDIVASLQIQPHFEELACERIRAFASGIDHALGGQDS
ncbi:hypothetical protein [Brevibacterium renqingii]|uniref:hypothetical protein n=1 Tax=Brevibacterium renqingii TaxID=2776916 RepID=UPI001AE07115|nr:hypothetical protein [Brevibacterium renqingii]